MRRWIAITVVAVALTACTDAGGVSSDATSSDDNIDSGSQGNVAIFCRVWPDARQELLGIVAGETTIEYGEQDVALAQFFADVDSVVPTELRTEWSRAYATYQQVSDLLFITGYSEGTIRSVHLEMAFGDAGPDGAVAATEAAVATIDEWAITACGDFASRWQELEQILQIHDQPDWRELARNIVQYEDLLAVGERLVPDDIATDWDIAARYQRGYFDLGRSIAFDAENMPEGAAGEALFLRYVGLSLDEAREASDRAKERISAWVEANPEATTVIAGTAGSPGSLSIRILPHRYLTNRRLLLVLLPPGTTFATVRSTERYVAASCTEVGESDEMWEEWQAEAARQAREEGADPEEFLLDTLGDHFDRTLLPIAAEGEYSQPNVCWLMSHESEAALVPGGAYELFVGAYHGEPGNYGLYLAAPEHCLQVPVTVSGDTVIDLPELEPCGLEPLGRPEEVARRTPPPVETGGTLHVEVDGAVRPEGFDHCRLDAMLLPAGTTLNDIGRGDTWPSGMFTFHRQDPRHVGGEDEQRWARSPGLVPIMQVVPSGMGESPINPDIRGDGPWDTRFPDPVALAAGSYDLRIEETCENEGAMSEDDIGRRCAFVGVEVDGATVVKMPELGACP